MSSTDTFDMQVRLAVYRLFVDGGHAPIAADIAEELSTTSLKVEEALRRLHDAHLLVLAPGTPYIWMANPLSALPTPYRIHSGSKTFWGNCIWDALGAVAMLGADGDVAARCPDCGDEMTVSVRGGELETSDHLVHYAVPAAHWWDDIGFN